MEGINRKSKTESLHHCQLVKVEKSVTRNKGHEFSLRTSENLSHRDVKCLDPAMWLQMVNVLVCIPIAGANVYRNTGPPFLSVLVKLQCRGGRGMFAVMG